MDKDSLINSHNQSTAPSVSHGLQNANKSTFDASQGSTGTEKSKSLALSLLKYLRSPEVTNPQVKELINSLNAVLVENLKGAKEKKFRTSSAANDPYYQLPPLPADNKAFISIGRSAAELDVSKQTLQRWRRQGRIKSPIYLSATKAVYEVGYIRELKTKMIAGSFNYGTQETVTA